MRIYVVFTKRKSNVVIKKKKAEKRHAASYTETDSTEYDKASFGNSKAAFGAGRCRSPGVILYK